MNTVTSMATPLATVATLKLPGNFPVVLDEQAVARVEAKIKTANFNSMSLREVATLGADASRGLNKLLDGFLSRIDKDEAPQLFALVDRLSEAVEAENLPAIASRILDAQPTLLQKVVGLFSKKKLKKAIDSAYEEAARVAAGKSKSLADKTAKMEREFDDALDGLMAEMRVQEEQKQQYRKTFYTFAETVAYLATLLEIAQNETAVLLENGASPQQIADAEDKLQALTSRALAVEGTLSRLPSEELVIRQIQNAGVSTWQEVSTTASERFISIKETLLAIHGALAVRNVQRLAQQGADLDKNLAAVRGRLMKEVVTTSSNAPGDNRLAQANQLQEIVADTKSLVAIVEQAKKDNREKFAQARQIYSQARKEMLSLGDQISEPVALQS